MAQGACDISLRVVRPGTGWAASETRGAAQTLSSRWGKSRPEQSRGGGAGLRVRTPAWLLGPLAVSGHLPTPAPGA